MDKYLEDICYNPRHAVGFTGPDKYTGGCKSMVTINPRENISI